MFNMVNEVTVIQITRCVEDSWVFEFGTQGRQEMDADNYESDKYR